MFLSAALDVTVLMWLLWLQFSLMHFRRLQLWEANGEKVIRMERKECQKICKIG